MTDTATVFNTIGTSTAATNPDASTNVGAAATATLEVHAGTGGAGVIGVKSGMVAITDSGAALLTLAAPTAGARNAGGDDGKKLTIFSTTAQAHTVTTPANKINGNKLTATFAAVADHVELVAEGGVWYAINNSTTLS
ncbi:MAG TPA: hypothetical protein VH022_14450 [Candidatus Acidoferrum sp.]|jgi:hypothetical protein|nr:hypothetical protein [Candidatus Acidoferrum sp.]